MRVLHVLNGLNTGGAESFLMNLSKSMTGEDVTMDFLLRSESNDAEKIAYFQNQGGDVYNLPAFPRHMLKNYQALKSFIKKNICRYDIVHIHANSLVYFSPIRLAYRFDKKIKIVVHSHSTHGASRLSEILNSVNGRRLRRYNVASVACSENAGKWMFSSDFEVIPNSIDVDAYRVSLPEKQALRKAHHISEDEKLIAFVGRLVEPKNPLFMVPIMKRLCQTNGQIHLIVCGDGNLRGVLEEAIAKEGLRNNIHLLGTSKNIPLILKLADLFVMPSLFEGLGIAAVEAQCSGIPALLADRVPQETAICANVHRIELCEEKWVHEIQEILRKREFCEMNYKTVQEHGFGLKQLKGRMKIVYDIQ